MHDTLCYVAAGLFGYVIYAALTLTNGRPDSVALSGDRLRFADSNNQLTAGYLRKHSPVKVQKVDDLYYDVILGNFAYRTPKFKLNSLQDQGVRFTADPAVA